ncbi:iron ABC transporter substrate-binding protein [Cypionkella aquatica]|uniref:Iron ABC transporter substrate-binding protein n=1 Tax=Cypionkella aquatica TaxID=1756042 RepID=A0AA37TWL3_9RHOB|nr:siderophore ABC transporter substrate-binding protein [Cypionkella aquatica]GLS86082.1 iron ABC transporter substrate-binding protein [Cypionkella aquatica]
MLKKLQCAAWAALIVLNAAPSFAQQVTITTATGQVTLPAHPKTIAVLDIAALDTLTALGVKAAGVPDKLYVDYLNAPDATVVGTLFEPDFEALANLNPDLIVAGGRSSTQVAALTEVAPTIDMTIWQDVIGEAQARIAAYGALFGKEAEAETMTAALNDKIEAVRTAAGGKGAALILMVNGPKVAAYGKGSRFGWLHTALDIPEAKPNLDPQIHGDAVSFEFIAEVNPDWLIVVDRSAAIGEPASAATLDNPLVLATKAGASGQIITLSSPPVYVAGGGYTSLMRTLDELLAGFGG